jgi:hypothetical protein
MKGLSVDFQLEVLEGCGFHCRACYVDKDASLHFSEPQIERLHGLFAEFKAQGYELDHLLIGPTDFMTSESFEHFRGLESFGRLTSLFNATNWTTTLLARDWKDKIRKLSGINQSAETTFSIVLNPQKALDTKYLGFFRERCQELREVYGKPIRRFYVLFNAYPHQEHEKVDFRRDYLSAHRLVNELFRVPSFDHGFSFTRSDSLKEHKERIFSSMKWLNEIYDRVAEVLEIPIQFLIEGDYSANRYVFKEDRFYWAPLWHEPFVNFDPGLEVPVSSWTVEEFESFERSVLLRQFELMKGTVCDPCPHNAVCVKRGIVHLMHLLEEEECIVPRKAVDARGLAYA